MAYSHEKGSWFGYASRQIGEFLPHCLAILTRINTKMSQSQRLWRTHDFWVEQPSSLHNR